MTREEIRDQVRRTRREQGLPETVAAGRVLDELAAEVLAQPPTPVRHERVRLDDREAA